MDLSGDTALTVVLLLNVVFCAFMCGLTTFVHVVHYPAFHFIPPGSGPDFHDFHTSKTAFVVAFPMLAELGLTVALTVLSAGTIWFWVSLLSAALLAFVWYETAFRVIPVHNRLSGTGRFNTQNVAQLCRSNWRRTLAWNIRLLVLVFAFILFSLQAA
ncbi:hypothetical protein CYPRO_3306 [Cyclonatronum proteinivorum]|uniref:DUF1772 domain-containing protein n=1 Tax=Cyclonatronum proteinivorum TaxID=1457365 RepID=A0A345UPY7_9BACT|nr:hypothetical protein [Cyclonatronum proteinivorum]AXJ02539.1 hypothetical protein CYPRO_3306 [Cyclonatronum proteinivorum]